MAGIGASFIPDRYNPQLGIDGVALAEVDPNGPAARAGLTGAQLLRGRRVLLGDRIVAVDGKAVRSEDDVRDAFEAAGVGGTVTLTVAREGAPASGARAARPGRLIPRQRGRRSQLVHWLVSGSRKIVRRWAESFAYVM